MKRLFLFCVFLTFFSCLPVCLKRWTCGFKLIKVHFSTPFQEKWDVKADLSPLELSTIFSQPFVYLDRGAQSYVFVSSDGRYVLKLFRNIVKAPEKTDRLFDACVLAFTKAKEETGLLFLHLNETEGCFLKLQIRGPLGQSFVISLDKYRFAIQKRAENFQESFFTSYRSQDSAAIKAKIDSFVHLLRSRIEKGIRNTDPSVSRNFAFLGTQALEIDFGNYAEGIVSKEWEMARYTQRLYFFLLDLDPYWADYLTASLRDAERKELQIEPHLRSPEK